MPIFTKYDAFVTEQTGYPDAEVQYAYVRISKGSFLLKNDASHHFDCNYPRMVLAGAWDDVGPFVKGSFEVKHDYMLEYHVMTEGLNQVQVSTPDNVRKCGRTVIVLPDMESFKAFIKSSLESR